MDERITPLRVYGPEESFFTGKLEAYLYYKELPFERIEVPPTRVDGGIPQVPVVELADGRRMTDTTPILAWLEKRFPDPPVIPADPLQAFVSQLIEDYADEWLWRPAMHYRWSYRQDAMHVSRRLAEGPGSANPLPAFVLRPLVRLRQRTLFVRRDGVTRETWDHVEETYRTALRQLEAILADRPFLLGSAPTLADYGYFGSMFRHFGIDPTASSIMRETAPAVYAWVARVWAARASRTRGELEVGIPAEWEPVLGTIGTTWLPHLCANAEAWKEGRKRFDVQIEGVPYRNLRTARYRVWCLEELRGHFEALPEAAQPGARTLLEKHGCWEPLWRVDAPPSGVDPEGRAPFTPSASMTGLD